MSDEDRDIDIESDEDDELSGANTQFMTQAEKRAHHNALERKRRDHIKDSFHNLRDSVPNLQGEKVPASRAQILKQATDYIQFMTKKNGNIQTDIDDLKRQTSILEQQVRALERAKNAGSFAVQSSSMNRDSPSFDVKEEDYDDDSDNSDDDSDVSSSKRKRIKTNS